MTSDPPPEGHSGSLLDHARELIGTALEYLHARLKLAGMEAKEALVHFAVIIALAVGAVALMVFGYLFVWVGAAVLIARLLAVSPGWVILGLGVIHIAVALGCLLIAFVRLKAGVFTATFAELQKDQEWLTRAKK
jgi:uncharacterized membrane protein YqjE